MFSYLMSNRVAGRWLVLASSVIAASGASSLTENGSEYAIFGSHRGDQMQPHMSFNEGGGYLVAQDNSVDGHGLGIRARRYYPDMSASRWTFQVNEQSTGHQENAKVAVQKNGGAVFAWESSTGVGLRVFLRFMNAEGIFTTGDVAVSENAFGSQIGVSIAILPDDSVVAVWSEENRDGHMRGVFAQRFSPAGARIGVTQQINQSTTFNQRNPSVAAMPDGRYVIAWVSEDQRGSDTIDIYGRLYQAGVALNAEFRLPTSNRVCANPVVVATDRGFRAAWSARNLRFSPENWDVETRSFNADGVALGPVEVVNNVRRGDQFSPSMSNLGSRQLIVWTSFGQDGSDEGVFGRLLLSSGDFDGDEFLVNTRTRSKQITPTVSSVSNGQMVVAWAVFTGVAQGFDLAAQAYVVHSSSELPQPQRPFVSAASQNSITVMWPEIVGQTVKSYLVFIDEETSPIETLESILVVTRNQWLPESQHSVRVAYRLQDGRVSPASEVVSISTWSVDANHDGLPDKWQEYNWGRPANWPSPNADGDGDGATNLEEFYSGTDPSDAGSVLRVTISARQAGTYVEWGCQPGLVYQVQTSSDLKQWHDLGSPRFSASSLDSMPISAPAQGQYYRVIRMR